MNKINENGTIDEFIYDEMSGKMIHKTYRDVTNLVDQNKREFNASNRSYKKPMEKIASIDPLAAQAWCQKYGIKFDEFLNNPVVMRRFLADPDNAVWKTKQGKLKT